jgi:hypothetical protein
VKGVLKQQHDARLSVFIARESNAGLEFKKNSGLYGLYGSMVESAERTTRNTVYSGLCLK